MDICISTSFMKRITFLFYIQEIFGSSGCFADDSCGYTTTTSAAATALPDTAAGGDGLQQLKEQLLQQQTELPQTESEVHFLLS